MTHSLSNTFFIALLTACAVARAQPPDQGRTRLNIREAYQLARLHYPQSRQRDLLQQTKAFTGNPRQNGP